MTQQMKDWTAIAAKRTTDADRPTEDVPLRSVNTVEESPAKAVDWTQHTQRAYRDKQAKQASSKQKGRDDGTRMMLSILGIAILALAGMSWFVISYISNMLEDDQPEPQVSPAAVEKHPPAEQQTKVDPAVSPTSAGKCDSEKHTPITPGLSSPQAVVAQFQTAYYSQDVAGVTKALAKDSPLQKQDWEAVLADTTGSQFCLTMAPGKTDVVKATVTSTNAEGKKSTFAQNVKTKKTGEDYRIMTIEADK